MNGIQSNSSSGISATGEFLEALENPELFGGVANLLTLNPIERKEARLNFASHETKRVVDENEKFFDDILAETGDFTSVNFEETI